MYVRVVVLVVPPQSFDYLPWFLEVAALSK